MRTLIAFASLAMASWAVITDRMPFAPDSELCLEGACRMDQIEAGIDRMAATPKATDTVLATDPANPGAWCTYAEMLSTSGQTEKAAEAFAYATSLGPGISAVWMRAANFDFTHDRRGQGLIAAAHVLQQSGSFDEIVFTYVQGSGLPLASLLGTAIPADARSARAWLKWLGPQASPQDLRESWNWMKAKGLADRKTQTALTRALWDRKLYREASEVANDGLDAHGHIERPSTVREEKLSNVRFQNVPEDTPFDWALDVPASVELIRHDGLEIHFQGSENVDLSHLHQYARVTPGLYRFTAEVEGAGLNTDQGPYFRIVDVADAKRFSVDTPQIHGNVARSWITVEFSAAPGADFVDVQLRRNPSLRFDNLIAGTFHVFRVSLSAIPGERTGSTRGIAGGSLGWNKPQF